MIVEFCMQNALAFLVEENQSENWRKCLYLWQLLDKDTTIKICDNGLLVVTSSFVFYVITFEPIEVQTRSAPQNDCLNLSFVKDTYVDGRKLARNGRKMTIYIL